MTSNQTLESTRRMASQALERANSTMTGLRSSMHDATNRHMNAMGEYAVVGRRYVGEHPLKSALIAAAVGAVVAGIVIALRRRDHDDF